MQVVFMSFNIHYKYTFGDTEDIIIVEYVRIKSLILVRYEIENAFKRIWATPTNRLTFYDGTSGTLTNDIRVRFQM